MAYTSYPFSGQTTTEDQYSHLMREAAPTGVAGDGAGTSVKVTAAGTDMTLSIAAGLVVVRGFVFEAQTATPIALEAADSGGRVDTLVLRLDPNLNSIVPAVVKGTPGAGAPTLVTTDNGVYEFPLCDISITGAATSVSNGNIIDRRLFTNPNVWRDASRITDRIGRIGYNIERGYWEGWDGVRWTPVAGNFARAWAKRRVAANPDQADPYGGNSTWYGIIAFGITDVPAGLLKITAQHSLVGQGGRAGPGNVRISAGATATSRTTVNAEERMDVPSTQMLLHSIAWYLHPGGPLSVEYAHRAGVPAYVLGGGCMLSVEWVGERTLGGTV